MADNADILHTTYSDFLFKWYGCKQESETTSDAEAFQISKRVLAVLASDLQSQNDTRKYAYSVLQRVGLQGTSNK